MTTTVTIQAHCESKKEVHIEISGDPCHEGGTHTKVLQDGETHSLVVYDGKSVTVKEVIK